MPRPDGRTHLALFPDALRGPDFPRQQCLVSIQPLRGGSDGRIQLALFLGAHRSLVLRQCPESIQPPSGPFFVCAWEWSRRFPRRGQPEPAGCYRTPADCAAEVRNSLWRRVIELRSSSTEFSIFRIAEKNGQEWIRTTEGVSQRIYSPPRLATSVPTRFLALPR